MARDGAPARRACAGLAVAVPQHAQLSMRSSACAARRTGDDVGFVLAIATDGTVTLAAAATAELRRRDAVEAANAERLKSETALENARLQQQVAAMFTRALEFAPENAELHAVLGVLHNLSREYPKVFIGLDWGCLMYMS